MENKKRKSTKLIKMAVFGVIAGLLLVMVMLLPRGFKGDLSLIGQGSISIVLTHDKNLLKSVQLMELLNRIRSDYEPSVEFLVVDVVTADGIAFLRAQQVGALQLVIFGPDGTRISLVDHHVTDDELRSALDKAIQNTGV